MKQFHRARMLMLLGAALIMGCGRAAPEARRLAIISPHRDEIRDETAEAFVAWFAERNQARKDAAVAALAAEVEADSPGHRQAVNQSMATLLADWDEDEASEVRAAWQQWETTPGTEAAASLRRVVDAWNPPAVQIVWQDIGGGTSQIVKYVRAGLENPDRPLDIDVLFGGGTDIYLRMTGEGLLQPIDVPAELLARIPPDLNGFPLYDPKHHWFGPMLSSFGILSNRAVLARIDAPVPQHWEDLGNARLRGWIGTGDPRLTGSVHTVLEIMLQSRGFDEGIRLLLRMGANTYSFPRDSGTLTRDVVLGEVAAAGSIDVQSLSAVGRNPEMMVFTLPGGETIVNPDAVAVLKGAPHPRRARAFVEFTLSDAGQRLFFLRPGQPGGPRRYPLCRLSVVPGLYEEFSPAQRSVGEANPFAAKNSIRYDSKRGGRRWDALNDLFGAWIVDAHPDLREAWRAVCALPEDDPTRLRLEAELFAPPCTEAELDAYAAALAGGSPRVRTETVTRWGEAARQRYRRVVAAAEARP